MQGKKGVSRVSHRKDLRVLLRSLSVVVVGVRNDTLSQFHAMLLSCIVMGPASVYVVGTVI